MQSSEIEIPTRRCVKILEHHPKPWSVKPVFRTFHSGGIHAIQFEIIDNNEKNVLMSCKFNIELTDVATYEDMRAKPIEQWSVLFLNLVKTEQTLKFIAAFINETE